MYTLTYHHHHRRLTYIKITMLFLIRTHTLLHLDNNDTDNNDSDNNNSDNNDSDNNNSDNDDDNNNNTLHALKDYM